MKATALSNARDDVMESMRAAEAHYPFGARQMADYEGPIKRAARTYGVDVEKLRETVRRELDKRHRRESRSRHARK